MNPYYASDPRAWALFAIATVLTLMVLIPYITIQLNAFVVGYRLQCKLRPREFFVPAACLLAGQAQRRRVRKILENRLVPETTLRDISRRAVLDDQHVTVQLDPAHQLCPCGGHLPQHIGSPHYVVPRDDPSFYGE